MKTSRPSGQHRLLYGSLLTLLAILVITLALFAMTLALQSGGTSMLSHPMQWLAALDEQRSFEVVSNAADLVAAILAIAITVVAIIVELAANRYSHRISSMFVREPINIVVMSFFVIATIQIIWLSLTSSSESANAVLPNASFLMSMGMVTLAVIILLPYFAFVMTYLSPLSVIDKIAKSASRSLQAAKPLSLDSSKRAIMTRVDELHDIARRASELSDRAVAMASIDALSVLLLDYQHGLQEMPDNWFAVSRDTAKDPDFVSLSPSAIKEIESSGTWLDVKIMRQYLNLVVNGPSNSRDTVNLIAINTKRIGIQAITNRPQLVELCIRCFNSYLRASLNNKDQRASYYIMNQYRQLAEELMHNGKDEQVQEIALHFQFYGLLGFKMQMPFLLEVAAYDVVHLIEECDRFHSDLVDSLVELILELDQEIKEESSKETLLGIRRAQMQLAAYFLGHNDERRARRICQDLRAEQPHRLAQIRELLESENRPYYWEFTDRGVNFSYLEPELHPHLATVCEWLADETPRD